mgnify:CR=1 FL=1|jgi:hypothetical protein
MYITRYQDNKQVEKQKKLSALHGRYVTRTALLAIIPAWDQCDCFPEPADRG